MWWSKKKKIEKELEKKLVIANEAYETAFGPLNNGQSLYEIIGVEDFADRDAINDKLNEIDDRFKDEPEHLALTLAIDEILLNDNLRAAYDKKLAQEISASQDLDDDEFALGPLPRFEDDGSEPRDPDRRSYNYNREFLKIILIGIGLFTTGGVLAWVVVSLLVGTPELNEPEADPAEASALKSARESSSNSLPAYPVKPITEEDKNKVYPTPPHADQLAAISDTTDGLEITPSSQYRDIVSVTIPINGADIVSVTFNQLGAHNYSPAYRPGQTIPTTNPSVRTFFANATVTYKDGTTFDTGLCTSPAIADKILAEAPVIKANIEKQKYTLQARFSNLHC